MSHVIDPGRRSINGVSPQTQRDAGSRKVGSNYRFRAVMEVVEGKSVSKCTWVMRVTGNFFLLSW